MPKSIQDRVRAAIAKRELEQQAAERKAGEHERRSTAARRAAEARREKRDDDIIHGRAEPRNKREADLQFRAFYGAEEDV